MMDERYDLILNMKSIRKTAFVIGLGATVGVGVGKVINGTIGEVAKYILKTTAKRGNRQAQEQCKKLKIAWENNDVSINNEQEIQNKIKIGFHA